MNNKKKKGKLSKKVRLILVMLLVLILLPVGITFSKYINDFIGDYLIKTNNFFFSSDKLGSPTLHYNVNNWGGVGNFKIQFELNNHKNNLLVSDSDIDYTISLNCSSGVTCTINSNSGTIYKAEMTDSFEVIITPQRIFNAGESVTVSITASSTTPYVKTLGATFTITVGRQGIGYEISDQVGQPYMNMTITNARDQYVVAQAFGNYAANDVISTDVYRNLSSTDQAKCYSARITLTFDPQDVIIDTTSNLLKTATYTTTTISGVAYISSITFDVEAMSSNVIRFYKIDVTENYTYPYQNNTSIITFNAI